MSKYWSGEEDVLLKELWPDVGLIAEKLGRSPDAIRWRSRKLGLRPPALTRALDTAAAQPTDGDEVAKRLFDSLAEAEKRVEYSRAKLPPIDDDIAEHEAGFVLSDSHVGQIVSQSIGAYSTELFLERGARLERAIQTFTGMYQKTIPLNTLNIFALGDDLEGHGRIYEAQALFMDRHLREQWAVFAEWATGFLRSMLAIYRTVNVFKVVGNHGRVGRKGEHHPQDNVEAFLWQLLKERFRNETRIRFEIANDFFMLVRRVGKLFLLTHGDSTLPFSPYSARGAMNTKLRMNSLVGEVIDYLLVGHHHTPVLYDRELVGEILYNGCWVGPNDLSVRWLHEGNLPSQWFFLLHPKYGMIHTSKIKLALPEELRAGLNTY